MTSSKEILGLLELCNSAYAGMRARPILDVCLPFASQNGEPSEIFPEMTDDRDRHSGYFECKALYIRCQIRSNLWEQATEYIRWHSFPAQS
jgi:hypothetical protein